MSLKHILVFVFLALFVFAGCEDDYYTPIAPSLRETDASWSPDGSTIAYCRHPLGVNDTAGIWLVDSDGTNDRYLCDGFQADWSPDGERLVVATLGWCIYLIDKDGSNFEWLIRDGASNSPTWSPDGKWVAFRRPFGGGGYLINLETREEKDIAGEDWAPDSRSMVYIIFEGGYSNREWIKIVDIQDSTIQVVREFDSHKDGALVPPPRWSPDGKKILFQINLDTWVVDTNGKCLRRLAKYATTPNWSHDGKHIVYTPYEDSARLWIMNANGWNKHPLREE